MAPIHLIYIISSSLNLILLFSNCDKKGNREYLIMSCTMALVYGWCKQKSILYNNCVMPIFEILCFRVSKCNGMYSLVSEADVNMGLMVETPDLNVPVYLNLMVCILQLARRMWIRGLYDKHVVFFVVHL